MISTALKTHKPVTIGKLWLSFCALCDTIFCHVIVVPVMFIYFRYLYRLKAYILSDPEKHRLMCNVVCRDSFLITNAFKFFLELYLH